MSPPPFRPALREQTYFVLAALIDEPLHGYGIVKGVEELSERRLRLTAGTLYGMLDRLVAQGLIAPEREQVVEGRLRRYYRLTDEGTSVLREEADRLQQAARAVTRRLGAAAVTRAVIA
jgi:PadR family transcriptional regulator, regulatory protein PadR